MGIPGRAWHRGSSSEHWCKKCVCPAAPALQSYHVWLCAAMILLKIPNAPHSICVRYSWLFLLHMRLSLSLSHPIFFWSPATYFLPWAPASTAHEFSGKYSVVLPRCVLGFSFLHSKFSLTSLATALHLLMVQFNVLLACSWPNKRCFLSVVLPGSASGICWSDVGSSPVSDVLNSWDKECCLSLVCI